MITKEQIEQAAQSYRKRAISSCFDGDDPNIHFTAGAEWALEQCPYSKEDMIDFGQMCLAYIPIADVYCRRNSFGYGVVKNLGELFKKWEEQK